MKKVVRFMVRLVLFLVAMVAMAPAILIFAEGPNLWPNFLGLAYASSLILIYKAEGSDGWLHKVVWLYRIAFKKLFDL